MKKKSEEKENCCKQCKYFIQHYIIRKRGWLHTIGYGHCSKCASITYQTNTCFGFEKGNQEYRSCEDIKCFHDYEIMKNKLKQLKVFLNNMKD